MKIQSYKELEAYKKSYELVIKIYNITQSFPKEELYGLISQVRRSAVSIPSNIAEGYRRGSKEYVHFLKVALGSCAELETQLSLSKDIGFCSSENFHQTSLLLDEVMKLLVTYIRKLSNNIPTNRYTLTAKR